MALVVAAATSAAAIVVGGMWWRAQRDHRGEVALLRDSLDTARAEIERDRRAASELRFLQGERERARTEVQRELERSEERAERLDAEVARLGVELETVLAQNRALTDALAAAQEDVAEARAAAEAQPRIESIPEGLRLALVTLHELLRADGVEGMRILRTDGIEDHALLAVQLLDHDPASLRSTLYRAERLTLTLDRGSQEMELRFFDGARSSGGDEEAFPEEGFALRIPEVDGREWERRLPYLVRSEGAWPEPDAQEAPRIHPAELAVWRERLGNLLAQATTERKLSVKGLRTLHEGAFLEVAIAGYENNLLASYIEGERVVVLVDDAAGLVYLDVRDGYMRDEHGETRLGASGYRMLLEGVEPKTARKLMMGLVTAVE